MEAGGGEVEDAREVLVADQRGRCRPARKGWWLRSRASRTLRIAAPCIPQEGGPTLTLPGPDQLISGFEPVVEPVVDVAELEELDVRELDDLQGLGAVAVGDPNPAAQSRVTRSVGVYTTELSRLASATSPAASGLGSSRIRRAIQSVWSTTQSVRVATWKTRYSSLELARPRGR